MVCNGLVSHSSLNHTTARSQLFWRLRGIDVLVKMQIFRMANCLLLLIEQLEYVLIFIYISFSIIDSRDIVKMLITLNLYLLKAHSWIRTIDLRCDPTWYDLTQSTLRTIFVTFTIFSLSSILKFGNMKMLPINVIIKHCLLKDEKKFI